MPTDVDVMIAKTTLRFALALLLFLVAGAALLVYLWRRDRRPPLDLGFGGYGPGGPYPVDRPLDFAPIPPDSADAQLAEIRAAARDQVVDLMGTGRNHVCPGCGRRFFRPVRCGDCDRNTEAAPCQ